MLSAAAAQLPYAGRVQASGTLPAGSALVAGSLSTAAVVDSESPVRLAP